jgi:hypothetical protein
MQVGRLPVLNRDKRFAGIILLGDGEDPERAALSGVSEPGGPSSQSGDPRRMVRDLTFEPTGRCV